MYTSDVYLRATCVRANRARHLQNKNTNTRAHAHTRSTFNINLCSPLGWSFILSLTPWRARVYNDRYEICVRCSATLPLNCKCVTTAKHSIAAAERIGFPTCTHSPPHDVQYDTSKSVFIRMLLSFFYFYLLEIKSDISCIRRYFCFD
jgi:hypothetical protein